MSLTKRLIFLLIALLILAFAMTALISSDSDNDSTTTTTTTTTTAAVVDTVTKTATTPVEPVPPLLKAGSVRTITVTKGDTVRFRVVNPTAEEVHVHGYDFTYDLEPGVTKAVSFPAKIEGQFEIELEGSATQLAKLVVNPK